MQDEKFLILKPKAFRAWLNKQTIKRTIKCVQMHHTNIPAYKNLSCLLHKSLGKMKNATTVPVPQPHDGIVPVASQQLDKSKGNNVMWGRQVIKGVNHAEQRNHPKTKEEFIFAL